MLSFSVPVRSYSLIARVAVAFPVMMDMLTAMLSRGCSGEADSSEESHAAAQASNSAHAIALAMRIGRSVVMLLIYII